MNPTKIRTSPSENDQKIAQHLSRVVRELESALAIAKKARPSEGYLARRVEEDISRMLVASQSIGKISPLFSEDSEEVRVSVWRQAQKDRDEKRKAEKAGEK